MLEDKIDLIAVQVEEGFFSKDLLWKLIKKATSPFTLNKDGYATVVGSDGATCASVAALMAVDNVLNNKRKADEILMIEAKRRKLNGKKHAPPTQQEIPMDSPWQQVWRYTTIQMRKEC